MAAQDWKQKTCGQYEMTAAVGSDGFDYWHVENTNYVLRIERDDNG